MENEHQERKLTTILSADVVGFSKLMNDDESGTLAALKELRRSEINPRIESHHGRTIKLMGDGSLVEFASVVDAVSFAVDVQHALARSQDGKPEEDRIRFRIGINVGDVIVDGDDIYGDGVNVAARIEGLAEPGGICVSHTVFDHVEGKLDLSFTAMGPQHVKNIPAPLDVYKIDLDNRSETLITDPRSTDGGLPTETKRPGVKRWVLAAALLAIGVAFATLQFRPAPAAAPVIAVLPFEDFSAEPHQGVVNDAVSDGIITSLARYGEFTVISRRSSFKFRDSDLGISEVADQLGADFVLEGSQQFDGKRLRTAAQLIDAETQAHVWTDEFDVPLGEMLKTNSLISRKIANAVGAKVVDTAEAQMTKGDVSALLIANAAQSRIMRNFSQESLLKNIEEQEQSLKDYPDSAWGYLGQALSLRIGLRYGWIEGDEDAIRKRMHELARRGVELDPNNFLAYHALGRALMMNRDVEAAAVAFRHAVDLNPSSFFARNALAQALSRIGKTEEALAEIAEIERIDPLYGHNTAWDKAIIQWQIGECEQARETFLSDPSVPTAANKALAAIHHCLGNLDKAAKAMAEYVTENPNWTVSRERDVLTGMWTAPGALNRWLEAMKASGMPL
ncbi:Adenylate cyclase, class 3 [Shimia gijangensis]|uniref:Adenylate cyclase, class 3 n=1 Tax=Shimia gijangensis TaxID=1470563 RepID=A0A1M6IGW7_9RHOB|nr:adenylate/guanylate cyclase domain-containing protein [Shimia gijangensis]SHJ33705.1 Adenylate cyclase, class 3 [Shimia gijangensis]